jgi:hypothetical protein
MMAHFLAHAMHDLESQYGHLTGARVFSLNSSRHTAQLI